MSTTRNRRRVQRGLVKSAKQDPNALTDLRAFRKTQDLTRRTDDLVNVQRLINEYKRKLSEQSSAG